MLTHGEDLVGTIEELRRSVRTLEDRVAALEAREAARPHAPAGAAPLGSLLLPDLPVNGGLDAVGIAILVGQGLLGLAGAYLLRAVTEQGTWPAALGYSLGAIYALVWAGVAYQAARASAHLRATAFATLSCMIGYPLIWEATVRVHLLDATAAAGVLAMFTGGALLTSARVRLQPAAWIVTAFAVSTTVALLPAAARLMPLMAFVIALGVATLWLGYVCDWFVLRWPMAVVADLLVAWVVFSVPPGRGLETPTAAIGLGLLLAASYLASTLVRTLWRAREVLPFEVVQGFAVLAIGIGGPLAMDREGVATAAGGATMLLGAALYLASVFVARQRGTSGNFTFYTTMALALMLTGVTQALTPTAASYVLSVLLAVAAFVAARHGVNVLAVHAAAYAVACAFESALAGAATARLVGPFNAATASIPPAALVCTLVAGAAVTIPRGGSAQWSWLARLARAVLLAVAAVGLAAWTIDVSIGFSMSASAPDAGALAALRTCVIALSAVVLSWLATKRAAPEAVWLAYMSLAAGGLKLLVEDLPHSRPATLSVALAAYGAALTIAPRLLRRRL